MKNESVLKELPMKVLHVLDHSLPYITGYSLRSHYIMSLQREVGMTPLAVTSPVHELVSHPMELIEGVFHYRTFSPEDTMNDQIHCPCWEGQSLASAMSQAVSRIAASQKIDLIHAHAPFTNGLAALDVCRTRGIPLLYEVREEIPDAVHEFRESLSGGPAASKAHALSPTIRQSLESFLYQHAQAVAVTGKRQWERIVSQGIPEENVYVIPHEEITQMLKPGRQDDNSIDISDLLGEEHNLQDDPVADFMCSFYQQEGVVPLLRILLKVRDEIGAARFLSIQSKKGNDDEFGMEEETGGERDERRSNPSHCDKSGHIIYVGQVKPRNKERFHSLINVLVYPWVKIGSNGKPLLADPIEALAVNEDASPEDSTDLYGLAADKQGGSFLREGDISSLAGKCLKQIMSRQMQQNREETIHRQSERSPARLKILAQYLKIYKKLLTS
jgi:glycosyltransferase involved in cell wall biosynthesis